MSSAADGPNRSERAPGDLPQFELDFLVDDEVDPTELTVFSPNDDDVTTHWISIDFEATVPIEAVR